MQRLNKPDEPEAVRVCDSCIERNIIEEKRREYHEELSSEASKLSMITSSNEELIDLLTSKQALMSSLERELLDLQRAGQSDLELLQGELKQELLNSEKTEQLIDSLRKEINAAHEKERRLDEEARIAEEKARSLVQEINEVKSEREEVLGQTEFLESQLEGSVPLKEVKEICCDTCLRRLQAQSQETLH
jgi:chromosome segregation ATPase